MICGPHGLRMACAVDMCFAVRRGDSDGDILQGAAEAAHGVPFKMGKHQDGIIILKILSHIIDGNLFPALHRQLQFPVLIHDIHPEMLRPAMCLHGFPMLLCGIPLSFIGCIAFHNGAVYGFYYLLHKIRTDKILVPHLSGMYFDCRFPGKPASQNPVPTLHCFGGKFFCKINLCFFHAASFFLCVNFIRLIKSIPH